jgi:hypothetical protein
VPVGEGPAAVEPLGPALGDGSRSAPLPEPQGA